MSKYLHGISKTTEKGSWTSLGSTSYYYGYVTYPDAHKLAGPYTLWDPATGRVVLDTLSLQDKDTLRDSLGGSIMLPDYPAGWLPKPVPDDGSQSMIVGVCTHANLTDDNDRQKVIDILNNHGWPMRDEISWSTLEQTAGVFDPTVNGAWTRLDVYRRTMNHGDIAILDYSNKIYYGESLDGNGNLKTNIPTGDLTPWVEYCKQATALLAPYVQIFEIWNEPDIGLSTSRKNNGGISPQEYIDIQKACYEAVKPLYPNHTFIAPAVTRSGATNGWLEEWYRLGGRQYCDAVSIHHYRYWEGNNTPEGALAEIIDVHNRVPEDIYITEIGWPDNYVSVQTQWDYWRKCIDLFSQQGWIKGVWWYDLWNDCTDTSKTVCNYGFYDTGLNRKYDPFP